MKRIIGRENPDLVLLTGMQIMSTLGGLPYNLSVNWPENISGNGNYILKIQSSDMSETSALVYCFDSHTGFDPVTDLDNYKWILYDQVDWYRKQSSIFIKEPEVRRNHPWHSFIYHFRNTMKLSEKYQQPEL